MSPHVENSDDNKKRDVERIYKGLTFDLKSPIPQPHEDENCKCLIRFHNCTPHRIVPIWLDFKGLPIKYPVLVRGASMNIDTYISQLWFFKVEDSTLSQYQDYAKKVLAIPEETLNLSCNASQYNFHSTDRQHKSDEENSMSSNDGATLQGANNVLICSLCKYVLKKFFRMPTKVPCHHFTGEARLLASDLDCRTKTNFNSLGTYIYSCSEDTHKKAHAKQRRNIYLVESFHNLRERCFLTLSKKINQTDIVGLNLPITLKRDYIQFVTTLNKL